MPLSFEEDHYSRIMQYELTQTKRLSMSRLQRYILNRRYFYGENEDYDNLRQPLGIRYVPTVNQKHTHYLFGEWEKDIVGWLVEPWDTAKADDPDYAVADKIKAACYRLQRRDNGNAKIYRAGIDGSVYGDSVFRVKWQPKVNGIGFDTILPEYYHALWNPLDISDTQEVVIAYNMDRNVARSMFGTVGTGMYSPIGSPLTTQLAIVWEYWNGFETMLVVDGEKTMRHANPLSRISGDAMMPGPLPVVHIPNLGVNGEYWGFGDAEPIFRLADELNYRLADMGDVINYHAHPITLLSKFYGDVTQLPVSPDAVWDLGREGEATYLEWGGPPPEVMGYLEFLLKVMLDTTSLTPVAFGQTTSSQASSAALNVQMLPITEVVRRKRAQWHPALREMMMTMLRWESLVLEEEATGKFARTYGFNINDLERFHVQPKFSPILPRDRLAVVNEQVGLLSNHARSILYALTDLDVDDPTVERERIMSDIKAIADIEAKINMQLADHEAKLNMQMAEAQHRQTQEQAKTQMQISSQQHRQTMEADPTTDPERHARHLESIKTTHAEERKTTEAKAAAAERTAAAKISVSRVSVQSGGKNNDRAKGKSNQDGGQ